MPGLCCFLYVTLLNSRIFSDYDQAVHNQNKLEQESKGKRPGGSRKKRELQMIECEEESCTNTFTYGYTCVSSLCMSQ